MHGKNTTYIRKALLSWYRKTARDLPWRVSDVSPYTVMVSEIMLQQTQAARVAELLPVFLARYPTMHTLASATTADVIRHWKGLGYNNRAVRLRNAARMIVDQYDGVVPRSETQLRELPGFGPYTAAAVVTFAYNIRTVVLDVNVRRVYSRLMRKRDHAADRDTDASLMNFASELLPTRSTAEWYHAVMDLGATVCTARVANCSVCPLRSMCKSANALMNTIDKKTIDQRLLPKKAEPSINGIPRRIWRGRVVQVLRTAHKPMTLRAILSALTTEKTQELNAELFQHIINALTTDGVVERKGKSYYLSSS